MYGIYENGKVIAKFVAPMTIKSNQPVSISDTLSLSRQISKRGAQRWEITTNLEPLSTNSNELFVNLITKGFSEIVQVLMPQNYGVIKNRTYTSSATANATGNIYSTQVNAELSSGFMPKGTFVKFSSHNKIYVTTSDLNRIGVLNIFPPLKANVNGSMQCHDNVLMDCLYDTDVTSGMTFTDGILMDIGTVKLIEKL